MSERGGNGSGAALPETVHIGGRVIPVSSLRMRMCGLSFILGYQLDEEYER